MVDFTELLDSNRTARQVKARVKETGLKVLTIDIENSPNIAHVWGLFKQTVSLSQLQESASTISFAAKWYDEKDVMFYSDHHDGHDVMVERAYELLNEADMVIGYNSKNFDMKHLNREFLKAGYAPTTAYKDIDLLEVVRSRFRLTSNKLDYVAQYLGLGGKVGHTGHDLWVRCMAGDPAAWDLMKKYNIGDVTLTEQVYDKLRPWIKNHPHMPLYLGQDTGCPNCGCKEFHDTGKTAKASVTAYYQYRCASCGNVYRTTTRNDNGKLYTRRIVG